ncbi:MAG: hypothetical protein ACKPKO_28555, partial [Candidatus Fonsibacter sp.]
SLIGQAFRTKEYNLVNISRTFVSHDSSLTPDSSGFVSMQDIFTMRNRLQTPGRLINIVL